MNPWTSAAASRVSDGFIALVDEKGIRLDEKEEWLYIAETTGPYLTRFGGPDLRTAYIGGLLGNRIPFFSAPPWPDFP